MTTAAVEGPSALQIASWAARLAAARVPSRTVHQAAIAVRLAGMQRVLMLGADAFEGAADERDELLAVLRGVACARRPAAALTRIAALVQMMRATSSPAHARDGVRA